MLAFLYLVCGFSLNRSALIAACFYLVALCLERIVSPRRDAPVQFGLPSMETARDAAHAAGALVEAVALGNLTPQEGAHIMALVETYRRTLETTELEARIGALEEGQK